MSRNDVYPLVLWTPASKRGNDWAVRMSDEQQNGEAHDATGEPPFAHPAPALDESPTPIEISTRTRNILIGATAIGLILLFWAAPTILTIILGGGLFAIILSFPTQLLSLVMRRGLAILVTLLSVLAAIVIAILVIVPLLINQLSSLIDSIPNMTNEADRLLRDVIALLQERGLVSENTEDVVADIRNSALDRASQVAEGLLDYLLGAVTGIFDIGIMAFGIIFVGIYLLVDARRVKATFIRIAPHKYRKDAQLLWEQSGYSLSRYLGGLTISLLAQGVLSGLALWAIGVPFPLLLGAWVSVTAIIPYLGAFLGAIPAVIIGFLISPVTGLLVIILYIVIQQLESNLLTPQIQGQAVRVHPVIVLLAVIAGSEIDGVRGAVLAVPTLAVARVLFDFLAARLRVSP